MNITYQPTPSIDKDNEWVKDLEQAIREKLSCRRVESSLIETANHRWIFAIHLDMPYVDSICRSRSIQWSCDTIEECLSKFTKEYILDLI